MNEIEIYKSVDNKVEINVWLNKETVWLNRHQLALLFERDIKTVGKHIQNILREEELSKDSVVAKFATTAKDGKSYQVEYYNLDLIISLGYRINSIKGIQFRQWATQRLKDYLVKGYAINQKRLEQLQKIVEVIEKSGTSEHLHLGEAKGLLEILGNYAKSFILLNQYDSNTFQDKSLNSKVTYLINYKEAKFAITELKNQLLARKEATELFGNEKDASFEGTLNNIVQTFDNEYLYPNIESQAAHLLYFIIKNHPFSDGNKRIGAFMFIWFLEKNKHRFKKSGELKINDNGLTALALLVAQSRPSEKDIMIQLIINLIND